MILLFTLSVAAPAVAQQSSDEQSSEGTPLVWSIRSNMLYDAALIPNIGVEFAINDSWSVGANWVYAWWNSWKKHNFWRIYGGEFIVNKYLFRDEDSQRMTGSHVGAYFQGATYDFELGGDGIMANFNWGLGVSYGYSLAVNRSLNIDFEIGVGYFGGKTQRYYPDEGCYVWSEDKQLNYVGVTKLGVSLVWFLNR